MTVRGYIERLKNPMFYEIKENNNTLYRGSKPLEELLDREVVDMEVMHGSEAGMRFYLRPVKTVTVRDIINLCPVFLVLRWNNKDCFYNEAKEIPEQLLDFTVTAIKPMYKEWLLFEIVEP